MFLHTSYHKMLAAEHLFAVNLKPDYSTILFHTEKQLSLESVNSAVYFAMWYVVKCVGLCDLLN